MARIALKNMPLDELRRKVVLEVSMLEMLVSLHLDLRQDRNVIWGEWALVEVRRRDFNGEELDQAFLLKAHRLIMKAQTRLASLNPDLADAIEEVTRLLDAN
jgi:hypothetical protein